MVRKLKFRPKGGFLIKNMLFHNLFRSKCCPLDQLSKIVLAGSLVENLFVAHSH